MPNSSAATAKTKSAWLSGRMRLTVPSPGPRPNQPPRTNDSSARVDLEGVAGRRIEEAVDARAHVRHRDNRRRRARPPPTPPSPTTQINRMPAMKNSAPQTSAISMVWPKSGCSTSSATTDRPAAPSAMVLAGMSGLLRRFARTARRPGSTKAGLRNSDGWMLTPSEHDPAPRALDLGAEEQRRDHHRDADDEHDQRDAPDLARRQERRRRASRRRSGSETACGG